MKQILLRVPDELHRRLTERARRDGRSVNALAGELLDLGAESDTGDRQARLRARIVRAGLSATAPDSQIPAASGAAMERDAVIAGTRGWGPIVDDLLAEERDPR